MTFIGLSFTDPSIANAINGFPESQRRNVEDVINLPTYSSFRNSALKGFDLRSPSPGVDLVSIFKHQGITLSLNDDTPSGLVLAYHRIRIALTERKLYVQLMSQYAKFFETSFINEKAISEGFEKGVIKLYRWRRRSSQSSPKVRMTKAFVEYWCWRDGGAPQQ